MSISFFLKIPKLNRAVRLSLFGRFDKTVFMRIVKQVSLNLTNNQTSIPLYLAISSTINILYSTISVYSSKVRPFTLIGDQRTMRKSI